MTHIYESSVFKMNHLQRNNLIILITAIIISFILKVSHILLPFMFGPIIATILCVRVFKLTIKWLFWLSQMGLIFLGIEIGSTFTKSVIGDISNNWLTIIIVTVLLIVISLLIAFFFKKIAKVNVNIETAILSVIPGALSQMLIIAEENKNSNILVVSLTQTSRIIFVVILVPLISYFFQDSSSSKEVGINSTILYHVP